MKIATGEETEDYRDAATNMLLRDNMGVPAFANGRK